MWGRSRRIEKKLDTLTVMVDALLYQQAKSTRRERRIMADLTELAASVAENSDAVASAVALLDQLADALAEAATDPDAVAALADQIRSNTAMLAAAVVANTPAAPDPVLPDAEPAD